MKCQNCNFENSNDAIFCKNCGARLSNDSNNASSTKQNQKANSNNDEFVTYPKAEENQGCLTKAWYDIRSTDKWVKKIVLIALCNIVPILEFASTGHSLEWGIDAAKAKNNELNHISINNKTIKLGFFEWVSWLAYGFIFFVASSLLTGIFGKVWLIGSLIGIALIVAKYFYDSFVTLSIMKMSIDDKLSSVFDFKNIWTAYKKNLSAILCVFFVPSILCSLIAIGLCLLFFVIFSWSELIYLISYFSQIQYTIASASSAIYLFQVISSIIICLLLCYISISFMCGIEKVIRYRAVGIFVDRCSKDWIE